MKATILQVDSNTNKKTGEVTHEITALGSFSSFGKIRPGTVQIRIDGKDLAKYESLVGKEYDFDVIIPQPDFPLHLVK